jgi:hypothetical protein
MPADALPDAWATPAPAAKPVATDGTYPPIELPHSKALARLTYNPKDLTLLAEFRNGSIYRYFGVSVADYTTLATSASPGARFNSNIAPYHEHERLA